MSLLHVTEGIVIKTTPFRDWDQIMTLFTPEKGLLKLVVKRCPPFCAPLHKLEVCYRDSKQELKQCQQVDLLSSYLSLKKELKYLETACSLLLAIQTSQAPEKPAPLLYQLLLYFLDRIAQSKNLTFFSPSFRLKVLQHEGLLTFPLPTLLSSAFDSIEKGWIEQLTLLRNYNLMAALHLPDSFVRKIESFFLMACEENV